MCLRGDPRRSSFNRSPSPEQPNRRAVAFRPKKAGPSPGAGVGGPLFPGHVRAAFRALDLETGGASFMGTPVSALRTDAISPRAETAAPAHASSPSGGILAPAFSGALSAGHHRSFLPRKALMAGKGFNDRRRCHPSPGRRPGTDGPGSPDLPRAPR